MSSARFRYLQKTGQTLGTVVGLTLFGVGLVLLGCAATVAWKALPRWWRLVLLPATVVVLVTVLGAGSAARSCRSLSGLDPLAPG